MPTHSVQGKKLKRNTRNWKDKVLKVSPISYKHTPIKTVCACVGRCALQCLEKITWIVTVSSCLSIQHFNILFEFHIWNQFRLPCVAHLTCLLLDYRWHLFSFFLLILQTSSAILSFSLLSSNQSILPNSVLLL